MRFVLRPPSARRARRRAAARGRRRPAARESPCSGPARSRPDCATAAPSRSLAARRLHVDLRPVGMIGAGPARAGAVRRAHGERVVRRRARLIREQSLVVADGAGADSGVEKARRLEIARRSCTARSPAAPLRRGPRGRAWPSSRNTFSRSSYCCGPSGGIASGIVGRELGERLGLAHGALEPRVREIVRRVTTACFGPNEL